MEMRLLRSLTGWRLVLSALGICSVAPAQDLEGGTWALGVERLYGITYASQTVKAPGGDVKTSALNYSLFSNPASSQRTIYSSPRLVLDYLITDLWSAGLGLGIVGGSTSISSETTDTNGPSIFSIVVAPRAGLLVAQNSWFAFWPKAGFTYTRNVAKTDNAEAAQYRGALSLEASALLLPGEHIILSFTPTFDWGLLGANSVGSGDNIRVTALELGLQGGLGVYF
jgi:hypothetical protein